MNRAIQNELLHPLSKYLIDESIRDGETARIDFDARANRLVVVPNHESTISLQDDDDQEMDDDEDDAIEVEELD